MSNELKKNDWLTPPTLFYTLGMIGSVFMMWQAMDQRVSKLEERATFSKEMLIETRQDVKEISRKIDDLAKRGQWHCRSLKPKRLSASFRA